jgi:hypothetical protein
MKLKKKRMPLEIILLQELAKIIFKIRVKPRLFTR